MTIKTNGEGICRVVFDSMGDALMGTVSDKKSRCRKVEVSATLLCSEFMNKISHYLVFYKIINNFAHIK